jgi:phosphopantothenoylcysteine decarboxylase/phosphopantothenate--cysteine ligase
MGYALARAALRRGAEVTLISGPTALEPPAGARLIPVTTAAEMREAVLNEFPNATAVIMAAAVSDYRPERFEAEKIKKTDAAIQLNLKPNPDILKELGNRKNGQLLVGFAAETNGLLPNAKKKLEEKRLDLIVANDVTQEGSGFDVDTNVATLLDCRGGVHSLQRMSKDELADRIYDLFGQLRGYGNSQGA